MKKTIITDISLFVHNYVHFLIENKLNNFYSEFIAL